MARTRRPRAAYKWTWRSARVDTVARHPAADPDAQRVGRGCLCAPGDDLLHGQGDAGVLQQGDQGLAARNPKGIDQGFRQSLPLRRAQAEQAQARGARVHPGGGGAGVGGAARRGCGGVFAVPYRASGVRERTQGEACVATPRVPVCLVDVEARSCACGARRASRRASSSSIHVQHTDHREQ